MAAPTLAALLHDLACLRQALECEDFGAAGEMLAGYELHLRQFIETFSPTAPAGAAGPAPATEHPAARPRPSPRR